MSAGRARTSRSRVGLGGAGPPRRQARDLPAGAQPAVRGAHRLRDVRHRVGRGLPQGPRRIEPSRAVRAPAGSRSSPRRRCPSSSDPNSEAGREALGISAADHPAFARVRFVPFRERPGEDASCLNLYAPQEPRILGATPAFLREARFSFQASLATTPQARPRTRGCCSNRRSRMARFRRSPTRTRSSTSCTGRSATRSSCAGTAGRRCGCASWRRCATASCKASWSSPRRTSCRRFRTARDSGSSCWTRRRPTPRRSCGRWKKPWRTRASAVERSVGPPRRLPPRREHVPLHVPVAGRPRPRARHRSASRPSLLRNVLERRRELALLRAVGYRRPRALAHHRRGERAAHGRRPRLRQRLRAAGDRAGAARPRRLAAVSRPPAPCSRPCWPRGVLSSLAAVVAVCRMPLLASLRSE